MSTHRDASVPVLEVRSIGKDFGSVRALHDVSMTVGAGEVTCLLGDNGAGKSTLVNVLSGVDPPSSGEYRIDGRTISLESPRQAMALGIATVHQDLALVPLMSVWRNFFLGAEPTRGRGLWRRIDGSEARRIAVSELEQMGIALRDPGQTAGTLSGGERQSVAIARALYLGARVLILDEPTAALGVKQTQVVLESIVEAKRRGVGVVLITHNPRDATAVGDRFVVLRQGRVSGRFERGQIDHVQLADMMAGSAPG
jgi:simple sugar transport system ATP-binding protein